MLRKSVRRFFRYTFSRFASLLVFFVIVVAIQGQSTSDRALRVSYFVAPEYPPLARQAMQSGDVVLTVTVDPSGKPTDVSVQAPHVLLGESAKRAVSQWRFDSIPPPLPRKGYVFFHYGFSGTPRDCNPATVVAADLEARRVIVTVDPRLPFAPDTFSPPGKESEQR